MKNLFIITILLICIFALGQKKKSTKMAPPPVVAPKINPPATKKAPDFTYWNNAAKCYIYRTEEKKDSLVYVTENLLEYGWVASNARMIITTYSFDPIKKQQVEKDGYIYGQSKTMQYIDGEFALEKGNLTFTPNKKDKFDVRHFKLVYKPKTQKVNYIKDENDRPYKIGDCPVPTVSL